MVKSLFTNEQIVFVLKQNKLGTSVSKVCRNLSICDVTFYTWRKSMVGFILQKLSTCGSSKRKIFA
ncbi:transposase [Serratia sp. IR-2025]